MPQSSILNLQLPGPGGIALQHDLQSCLTRKTNEFTNQNSAASRRPVILIKRAQHAAPIQNTGRLVPRGTPPPPNFYFFFRYLSHHNRPSRHARFFASYLNNAGPARAAVQHDRPVHHGNVALFKKYFAVESVYCDIKYLHAAAIYFEHQHSLIIDN